MHPDEQVIPCQRCRGSRFYLAHDERAGRLTIYCEGCDLRLAALDGWSRPSRPVQQQSILPRP